MTDNKRYKATPINDGSTDGTGENWNECTPETAQGWAVEDTSVNGESWLMSEMVSEAEAKQLADEFNAEPWRVSND